MTPARPVPAPRRVDDDLERTEGIHGTSDLEIVGGLLELAIPAVREVGVRAVPGQRRAVVRGRDSTVGVEQDELVVEEDLVEEMPVPGRDGVMEHELGPGRAVEVTGRMDEIRSLAVGHERKAGREVNVERRHGLGILRGSPASGRRRDSIKAHVRAERRGHVDRSVRVAGRSR